MLNRQPPFWTPSSRYKKWSKSPPEPVSNQSAKYSGHYRRVGMAEVRFVVDIVDRRRDVVGFGLHPRASDTAKGCTAPRRAAQTKIPLNGNRRSRGSEHEPELIRLKSRYPILPENGLVLCCCHSVCPESLLGAPILDPILFQTIMRRI